MTSEMIKKKKRHQAIRTGNILSLWWSPSIEYWKFKFLIRIGSVKSIFVAFVVWSNIFSPIHMGGEEKTRISMPQNCELVNYQPQCCDEKCSNISPPCKRKPLLPRAQQRLFPYYQLTVFGNQIFSLHERENFKCSELKTVMCMYIYTVAASSQAVILCKSD